MALSDLPDDVARAEIEETIRSTYRIAWEQSKRWPNLRKPPELEIFWDEPGGITIKENF